MFREVLVLNDAGIRRIAERDRVYAREMRDSRDRFVRFLRGAPAFIKLVKDDLRPGDYFRAVLPPEVQRRLRNGTLEQVRKRSSGLFNGMIRKVEGRKVIEKQTEWVQETPDARALANLNAIAVQASIADVTELLLDLDKKLDLVLAGQHSDRVARVFAGRDAYEQALDCPDEALRSMFVANAVQSLNEGRRMLMAHLESTLKFERSEPTRWQRFLLWVSRGRIDEMEFELLRAFEERYPAVKEDVRYINLATVYLARSYVLLGQHASALASATQHELFCGLLADELPRRAQLFPYEAKAGLTLPDLAGDFAVVRPRLLATAEPERDLIIDVAYEEIYDHV